MIKQDTLENPANSVYLALGSNLGNKRNNINMAKYKLIQNEIEIIKLFTALIYLGGKS